MENTVRANPYQPYLNTIVALPALKDAPIHLAILQDDFASLTRQLNVEGFQASELQKGVATELLTPLHLAAMTGNRLMVELLLKKGAKTSDEDCCFYTPAHHAAIRQDANLLQTFRHHNPKDMEAVTNRGGTVDDFADMLAPPPPLSETTIDVWDPTTQSVISRRADLVFATDKKVVAFSNQTFTTPERLVQLWRETPRTGVLNCQYSDRIRELMNAPSRIYVDTKCITQTGVELSGIGLVLKAKAALEPGDFVCFYGGVDDGANVLDSEHRVGDVDGGRVRSYGALAPDSFPNAMLLPKSNACGRMRYMLIAVSSIKAGEVICIDYHRRHRVVKNIVGIELRLLDLYQYWGVTRNMVAAIIAANRAERQFLISDAAHHSGNNSKLWKDYSFIAAKQYVENTPAAYVRCQLNLLAKPKKSKNYQLAIELIDDEVIVEGVRRATQMVTNYPDHYRRIFLRLLKATATSPALTVRRLIASVQVVSNVLQTFQKNLGGQPLDTESVKHGVDMYIAKILNTEKEEIQKSIIALQESLQRVKQQAEASESKS